MGDRPVRRPLIGPGLGGGPVAPHGRTAVALLLLGLGAATSAAVAVLQPLWWGLGLGLVATGTSLWALPDRWWGRLPFGLGWAGAVVLVADGRTEGDFVLASDTGGYVVLASAVLVTVVALASLRPHRGPAREDSER